MNALYKKAILVMMVFPLAFSTVYAKGGHRNNTNEMSLVKMLKQVDLTSEQKVSVKSIINEYQPVKRDAIQKEMMEILKMEKFDIEKAKALIVSMDALKDQNKLNRLQMRHDIYQLLTAEQQAKMELLIDMEQQKGFKKGKKGQGKNNKQGNGQGWLNDNQTTLN